MKKTIKRMAEICKTVFGYGIFITLFAGGLTFFGYLAALIIGGTTAAAICTFIYKEIIPIIIYASNIMILLGVFTMYISGEYALTAKRNKK